MEKSLRQSGFVLIIRKFVFLTMYKGKSFLVSVSKQHSQTNEQIANVICQNSPDNRCSSQHRVMECSLRFASLLVRYLQLDLNHGFYFSRGSQNNEKNTSIRKKVLYERKFNFQLDPNNHKLETLITISILSVQFNES